MEALTIVHNSAYNGPTTGPSSHTEKGILGDFSLRRGPCAGCWNSREFLKPSQGCFPPKFSCRVNATHDQILNMLNY